MATISNTPRPGYVWDATDNCWYPIGTGPHSHADYITSASAINPNIVDAKGDIIAATAADTVARLAVGSNNQVLTADSSTATGLKWANVAAGANWTLLNSGGTSLSGTSTTISGISGKDKLMIIIKNASYNTDGYHYLRLNGDTANHYNYGFWLSYEGGYSSSANFRSLVSENASAIALAYEVNPTSLVTSYCLITGCNASGVKVFQSQGSINNNGSGTDGSAVYHLGGYYNSSSTISSVTVLGATFDNGTIYVYGSE